MTNANEIFELINKLKSGKAPGPDGITSTMLKLTVGQVVKPLPSCSINLLAKVRYMI